MLKDFFKDRIVDWDSVRGLLLAMLVGAIAVCYFALMCHFFSTGHPIIGTAILCSPLLAAILVLAFLMCFPKDPGEAECRRRLREQRRKERAELRERKENDLKRKLNGRGLLWN